MPNRVHPKKGKKEKPHKKRSYYQRFKKMNIKNKAIIILTIIGKIGTIAYTIYEFF